MVSELNIRIFLSLRTTGLTPMVPVIVAFPALRNISYESSSMEKKMRTVMIPASYSRVAGLSSILKRT